MSVIIRLQNLPWNANANDIRRYFQGLSIPDGGVHIIGGDKGDAFIAFSTDEDARQAMMKDAGMINGFAVKLLLSSKTEMQNVITAAKGGPAPASAQPVGPKPIGFYDRPMVAAVGAAPAPVQYVGGNVGGEVTNSGQGLRSSTGLGNLPPVQYGYPGSANQMIAAAPGGQVLRMAEPRVVPSGPLGPPAARSAFDSRPADRPPMVGNFQHAPLDPHIPAMHPMAAAPVQPAVGGAAWGSSQLNSDMPPPQDFRRPGDTLARQGPAAVGAFNSSLGREPAPLDGRRVDANYPQNGRSYGAPDAGRNYVPAVESGRGLGAPPVDAGRDFGRPENAVPLNRPEERRESPRFSGDRLGWADRDRSGPGQGWSGSGAMPYGGRDVDRDSRRDFPRSEMDRSFSAPDRWLDNRGRVDLGPAEGPPPPRPGPGGPNDRYDRPFSESRFGPDLGPPGPGRFPDDRPRGDSRGPFGCQEPGFREVDHRMIEDPVRRLPPPPEQRWMDDRRGMGPRPDDQHMSPPRHRRMDGGFPPRDGPWRDGRPEFYPRPGGRDMGPARDLSLCAENFPRSFNYREVRRFFNNCEIPRDGVKLINDRAGMRTGCVFVQVANIKSLHAALDKHGAKVEDCVVTVERCRDEEFDMAVDGAPPKRFDRSRSPIRQQRTNPEKPDVTYYVLKKLPSKVDKEDIRKFFGKLRIAPDGGPFFELAFDKTPTGNALIAMDEKDTSKVLKLRHSSLKGARVDVINVTYHEYSERSRRARQCERDAEKDAGYNKPTPRDKKAEARESKAAEAEHGMGSDAEDEGVDAQVVYCLELRGIPYTASPAMLQDFFRDIDVPAESIHIVYNREHRATGIAFIELSSLADQKRALEKNKQHMGHRYVEIRALPESAMVEEYNKHQQKFGGPLMSVANRGSANRPSQGTETLLSMQNLHSNTQLEDILEFFTGYHPIVDTIKLQYKDGQPTGDGLVAFESPQEAESALRTKHRHLLLGKPVNLSWPKK